VLTDRAADRRAASDDRIATVVARVQSPADVTKRWTLILCCLAQFMVILDVSVVNVALPSIRNDLGFSVVDLSGSSTRTRSPFAGFLLLGGRAAGPARAQEGAALRAPAVRRGVAGRRLSQGQGQLIVARAFQGLGGAVVAPATLSVLTTTFSEGAERNRALSVWGAMGAAGGACRSARRRHPDRRAGLAVDPASSTSRSASSPCSPGRRFIVEHCALRGRQAALRRDSARSPSPRA
jgi:hypothetical protein